MDDKGADGGGGAGVGSALTDDDQRGARGFEELGDFEEGGFIGGGSRWGGEGGHLWEIVGGGERALDYIRWEINEGRPGSSIPGGAVRIVDCIWYCVERARTKCEFGMGSEEGDGIELLEGAFGCEMCLRRAGEE